MRNPSGPTGTGLSRRHRGRRRGDLQGGRIGVGSNLEAITPDEERRARWFMAGGVRPVAHQWRA